MSEKSHYFFGNNIAKMKILRYIAIYHDVVQAFFEHLVCKTNKHLRQKYFKAQPGFY